MSAAEFRRWQTFHADSPIDDQSNFHIPAGQLAMLYANSNRRTEDKPRPLTDFLPFWRSVVDESDGEGIDADLLMGDGW